MGTRLTIILILAPMLSVRAVDVTDAEVRRRFESVMEPPAPRVIPAGSEAGFGNTCADGGDLGTLSRAGGLLLGDNTSATDDYGRDGGPTDGRNGPCQDPSYLGFGGDVIASFTVDTTGPWTFSTCSGIGLPDPGFGGNTSLNILQGGPCPGATSVACNGDGPSGCFLGSLILDVNLLAGTQYYLIVDSSFSGQEAPFGVRYAGPCFSDQHCIDRDGDRFCTGVETCGSDATCTSTGDPCEETAARFCDEAGRQCGVCPPDDGDPCNGIETRNEATGECEIIRACPDGYCQHGSCQDPGVCEFSGDPCRQGSDCPFLIIFDEACLLPGTGSMKRCWDGRARLGPNWDCGVALNNYGPNRIDANLQDVGEVCVPDGNNEAVTCLHDDCWVHAADINGYFGRTDITTISADNMILKPAPAGRDVVSHELTIICRDGSGVLAEPYDLTIALWTSVNTDPNVDYRTGNPDAMIPGTVCHFSDNPCGNGIDGDPNRNTIITYLCEASGGKLIDLAFADAFAPDDWQSWQISSESAGHAAVGHPPLSQGVFAGSRQETYASCDTASGDCMGGVGWSFNWFGGFPFDGNAIASKICTAVVGPCCVVAGGCEMITEEDCAEQGGRFIGRNTTFTPDNTCDESGDNDGVALLCDNCPDLDNADQGDCDKDGEGDACEADENDQDRDLDGVCNGVDGCPDDPNKSEPGQCGCGVMDDDSDGDGTADCNDGCPNDPNKVAPRQCGCGVSDADDEDGDGVFDCVDQCPGVDDAVFAPQCDGAIPTASAWGLVVLALLLLVTGKLYFGRRAMAG